MSCAFVSQSPFPSYSGTIDLASVTRSRVKRNKRGKEDNKHHVDVSCCLFGLCICMYLPPYCCLVFDCHSYCVDSAT